MLQTGTSILVSNCHLTNHTDNMFNISYCSDVIRLANNSLMNIIGRGDLILDLGGNNHALLKDVLINPESTKNLISVSKLGEKGLDVTFFSNKRGAKVFKSNGSTNATCQGLNGLFKLNCSELKKEICIAEIARDNIVEKTKDNIAKNTKENTSCGIAE